MDSLITLSEVKQRWFTPSLIKKLLPDPTLKTNPHYRSGPKMKLYRLENIEAAMQTDEFVIALEKRKGRQAAAQKAVQTKIKKLENEFKDIASEISVSVIPLDELRQKNIARETTLA